MKLLFLLSLVTVCFVTPAMASDDEFTLECKHVRPSEAIRTLRSLSASGVSFKEEDRKVIVTGGDRSLYKRLKGLMEQVDFPNITICPRFIKLRFADASHVAAVISEAFPAGAGNEELPLQAAPSVRTNEVFLMGTVQDIQAAEALVLLLDQARTPARRGCGEAGF